jgi:pimeloyl-ACP methyl ester carboxylesterase
MKFFNGFSFCKEDNYFDTLLDTSAFCVAGFSLGAIHAFEYALNTQTRIDKLQLFSPAFFQDKNEKYKRLQLMYFTKNETNYYNQFITNVFSPAKADKLTPCIGTKAELAKLLFYEWSPLEIQQLIDKGIKIEVYLGEKDKIIDSQKAHQFFSSHVNVFFLKEVGHLLK